MNKIILNGSQEAKKIFKSLKSKASLVAILIGKDSASQIYINIKEKRAKEVGVKFKKHILPSSTSEKKVTDLIEKLNKDKKVNGILIQLPLPKKFNTQKIIEKINPHKDVDGFINTKIIPPTIQSIVHLIKMSKKKIENKKCIILTNSNGFSKPLEKELKKKKIKVNISLKPKKDNYSKYDVIVIALGKKHWLKPEMIKKGCIVIDVGINRINKNIYGDVHPGCLNKSKYISPVPGGVGPLTVAFLFKNLPRLSKS
ncbi:MAG: bifunctional 5,10-methylenetetrahydrofolate dehydrogenase/5,10-methenyltetrahydrofolate cyclohydrolase [Patescibacteria group bacterium]